MPSRVDQTEGSAAAFDQVLCGERAGFGEIDADGGIIASRQIGFDEQMRNRKFVEFGNGHGVETIGSEDKSRIVRCESGEIFFLECAMACENIKQKPSLFESFAEGGHCFHGHRMTEVAAVVEQQRDFAGAET